MDWIEWSSNPFLWNKISKQKRSFAAQNDNSKKILVFSFVHRGAVYRYSPPHSDQKWSYVWWLIEYCWSQAQHRPGPGKCFLGGFLLRPSRIKRSQVMSMVKFSPSTQCWLWFCSINHFFLGNPAVPLHRIGHHASRRRYKALHGQDDLVDGVDLEVVVVAYCIKY